MGRKAKPWRRRGRDGWWTKVAGKFVRLGDDERGAWVELHRISGSTTADARITVMRLADLWVAAREKGREAVADATFPTYRRYAQSLVDRWGRTEARDIREHHIDRWIEAHPTWEGCRSLALSVAKMIFKWGKRKGYLEVNPLSDMPGQGTRTRKPATREAIDKAQAGIRSEEFADLFAFMRATGVRPGEARTLTADRIDLESMVAIVRGKTGFRPVLLTAAAAEPLRRALGRHPDGEVFLNRDGRPWTPGALSEQVRRARERTGAGDVVAYNTRGEYATETHAAGIDVGTVARILGHSDTVRVRTLLKHYLKISDETLREAVEGAARARAAAAEARDRPGTTPRRRRGPRGGS